MSGYDYDAFIAGHETLFAHSLKTGDPGFEIPLPPDPGNCRVYWGSHGCKFERGHFPATPHECDCCECEDHATNHIDEEGVHCVAKPPYYGPDTRFYGEDVTTELTHDEESS